MKKSRRPLIQIVKEHEIRTYCLRRMMILIKTQLSREFLLKFSTIIRMMS